MDYQAIFRRYEIKYLLTDGERDKIANLLQSYMIPDRYPHSAIRNLYFDTDSFLLIRRSIEKPIYKEKLRIRSYGAPDGNTPIFMEIKKKYKSVVYKRRLALLEHEALEWVSGKYKPPDCQISREIDYTIGRYPTLSPKMFLSYERDSYRGVTDGGLRITFDKNILSSLDNLSLTEAPHGTPLLPKELSLMEIKCDGGIPLWLTSALSEMKIRKVSFSKYGTAYKKLILNKEGDHTYERYYLFGTF